MKKKFIVYSHHTVSVQTTIGTYSKAEAKYIIEQRMKRKGLIDAEVDDVVSIAEDQAINQSSDRMMGRI